jgi:hypothetical protein
VLVLSNSPPRTTGTWSADRFHTGDKISTVIDLAPMEADCDEQRATATTRARSAQLDADMFAFYRDVARVPETALVQLSCYHSALEAEAGAQDTPIPGVNTDTATITNAAATRRAAAEDSGIVDPMDEFEASMGAPFEGIDLGNTGFGPI